MTALVDRAAEIARIVADGIDNLRIVGNPSEADTQDQLIAPVLEALGYPRENARRHVTDRGNYPDRIVWSVPLRYAREHDLPARFIVEEKPLGADFERPRTGRADTPVRQIQRYLRQHRLADDSTLGILTDGRRWRVYGRSADPRNGAVTVRQTAAFDLCAAGGRAAPEPFAAAPAAQGIEDFVIRLAAEFFHTVREAPFFPRGRQFLAHALRAIAEGDSAAVAGGLADAPLREFIEPRFPSSGLIADARANDWEEGLVVGLGPEYRGDGQRQDSLLAEGAPRIRLATAPFRWEAGAAGPRLYKGDIALCARALAEGGGPLVLCAWTQRPDGFDVRMRIAVHIDGRTAMTPEFDPDLPPASVLLKIDRIAAILQAPKEKRTASALFKAFDILPLQREFYARVEAWLERRLKGRAGGAHDAALVRHLIRTLFAWVLKEHGIVPRSLFDRDFIRAALADGPAGDCAYHDLALAHLFHEALNRPEDRRAPHPIADIGGRLAAAPFLNGSIFAPGPDDELVRLPDDAYWSDNPDAPGLYDILEAFQWTLDEHSAQTHDLTLDPELLGALFERLIALVDRSGAKKNRKPNGAYYTPRDVVAVMASDALVARMLRESDPDIGEADLRALFSPSDDALPDWKPGARERVLRTLQGLTVFDPAVGSGAFLLGVLEILATAYRKLDPGLRSRRARGAIVRAIVRDQLHGGDSQPLACQIAKLRLYLAIEAAEGADTGPLPNLEARIVNADALAASPAPGWRPGTGDGLADADPAFRRLLAELAANRRAWFDAHGDDAKRELALRDKRLRGALAECARRLPLSPETRSFIEWSPLDLDDAVARTDPRLIFSREPWPGFDIVIGNPPYAALPAAERTRARDREYRGAGGGRIEALFVELAMALASPTHGVVELVLPLGVSFRQDHAALRAAVEDMCERIELRHHDMTPGRIFDNDPTAKDWPNKQRATLLTAVRGAGGQVRTTGLRRWFEKPARNERAACLANRRTVEAPRLSGPAVDRRIAAQWLRVPTDAVRALIDALVRQRATIGALAGAPAGNDRYPLALPHTAYLYVTALPAGAVSPRRENLLRFPSEADFKVALAALSGHVAYGWWIAVDDGFHVNLHTFRAFGLPDPWLRPGPERARAIALADALIAAIPQCLSGKTNAGARWQNVDFFSGAPDLIAELDRLQIDSLGLPRAPLLEHLRIVRSSSSWSLP